MTPERPLLVVFSGLPGTGKTTISTALAARLGAVHLRIDVIEQAMKSAGAGRIGPAGYTVACALAEANLRLGHSIVADCVNPVRDSRLGWRKVAEDASACLFDIHLVCSDTAEHRRRVECRSTDIPGLVLPGWDDVQARAFEPRDDAHLVLDTAHHAPEELVERCAAYVLDRPAEA
jgi:predicted kinase